MADRKPGGINHSVKDYRQDEQELNYIYTTSNGVRECLDTCSPRHLALVDRLPSAMPHAYENQVGSVCATISFGSLLTERCLLAAHRKQWASTSARLSSRRFTLTFRQRADSGACRTCKGSRRARHFHLHQEPRGYLLCRLFLARRARMPNHSAVQCEWHALAKGKPHYY